MSTDVGTLCHDWLTALLAAADRSPEIVHWSNDFAVHVELVRRGLANAVVPRLGRGSLPSGVRALEVRGVEPVRHVELIVRRSQRDQAAVRFMTERIAAAFCEPRAGSDALIREEP